MGVFSFGAFVRLDGNWDKDALVHVTQLKVAESGVRVEASECVREGDRLWVKVFTQTTFTIFNSLYVVGISVQNL